MMHLPWLAFLYYFKTYLKVPVLKFLCLYLSDIKTYKKKTLLNL